MSDSGWDGDPPDFDVPTGQLGLYAALLVVGAVLFLPTVQSLLYYVFVATPSVLQWGAVALVIAAVGIVRDRTALLYVAGIVFVVMGLLVGPVVGGIYAHEHVAGQMQREATQLETLPNTSEENVRVVPRSVSDNYAQSSMQYPQYRLTGSDITYRNGSYAWSYGLVPDNFFVSLFGHQKGTLYVDMTRTEKRVDVEETSFATGRGQLFFDSYRYQSVLASPLKQHDWETTFDARADGEPYVAHSTTAHEWKFRAFPVPQFYAVPEHGSVEVMHQNGDVESLSPEQARESPLLEGQNFYPYHVAMFKVRSMQYVHGPLNKWFWKEDVLSIADLPEEGNAWPIAVPTGDEANPRLTYFVATEPTGSGNGVYEVWTIDGQTGETGVRQYGESQIGPRKAVDFVERRPQVNRLSNADAVAPVPVVKDGTLYWHVKVVPGSRSGVVYTAFVNAESGDVTLVEGTDQIYAFMRKDEVPQVDDGTTGSDSGMSVTIVVTDADGEIVDTRNFTVPEGGSMELNVENEAGNGSTTGNDSAENATNATRLVGLPQEGVPTGVRSPDDGATATASGTVSETRPRRASEA